MKAFRFWITLPTLLTLLLAAYWSRVQDGASNVWRNIQITASEIRSDVHKNKSSPSDANDPLSDRNTDPAIADADGLNPDGSQPLSEKIENTDETAELETSEGSETLGGGKIGSKDTKQLGLLEKTLSRPQTSLRISLQSPRREQLSLLERGLQDIAAQNNGARTRVPGGAMTTFRVSVPALRTALIDLLKSAPKEVSIHWVLSRPKDRKASPFAIAVWIPL